MEFLNTRFRVIGGRELLAYSFQLLLFLFGFPILAVPFFSRLLHDMVIHSIRYVAFSWCYKLEISALVPYSHCVLTRHLNVRAFHQF